jgi:UDP-N-acetylglucosamine--N-acetylmuramyl-(pentapeptide) pyrophosphoryl-undecaprenol N-acetylglucosamine transferase
MDKGIVLLAAGGTGGHLFPAEALAHELKAGGWSVHLVTDSRAERFAGKFPADEIHVVPSATIGSKNPISVARSLFTLWKGIRAARKLMARLKPKVVVGFGGYPTVPPLLAATGMGIPSMIHEQNAVMGRANKALAARVKAIAGGFLPETGGQYADKTVTTGNPVRPAVLEAATIPYEASADGEFRLVVFGGSQGAQFFSKAIPSAIAALEPADRARMKITQQARPEDRRMSRPSSTTWPRASAMRISSSAGPAPRRFPKSRSSAARPSSCPIPMLWITTRRPMPPRSHPAAGRR